MELCCAGDEHSRITRKSFHVEVTNESRISDEFLRVRGDSMKDASFTSMLLRFSIPAHFSKLFHEDDDLLRIQTLLVYCFYLLWKRSVNSAAIFRSVHRSSHQKKNYR
jgi:hypothetical protein